MRESVLPYARQQIDERDINAVIEVMRSDWLTTGPKVAEFEETFADYIHARYAVSFSSGTAALHAATFAAGVGPNDEAVTTPMSFCATANCLLYEGAKPVFADVCLDTLNIDPGEVARRITSRTKAILCVDYAGHPADLDAILKLAGLHGLVVIEDACHALGAEYKGRRVGGISHMTVFSFHPVKHITTGEGGMVTTDDAELAHRLRLFRNHGIERVAQHCRAEDQWRYEMVELGYNYRLTDIACALGLSQLSKLEKNLACRRHIVQRYRAGLADLPEVILPVERSGVASAWHLYPIRLRLERLNGTRSEIFAALRAENVGVNVHYIPVHYHKYYRKRFGYRRGAYPIAEAAYESLITLPLFHGMTEQDVEDAVNAVKKVMTYFRR